ncbi:hypothetical protein [uncultured Psychroserpens sp.]|uniref:hypothetical protein n=1 Tax=uncultured Psychroserpens sp. TaxID=255436 RepID=UPI00261E7EF8|nr:hypothetical protein [uncultured Psychroserpens sp.]
MIRITILLLLVFSYTLNAQNNEFDDTFISENFKLLNSVDSELAIAISPIIEKRLVFDLKDSSSFYSPLTKLSKYVTIKTSEDSLIKTYSWDRINGGSWHDMASYAQFKTSSGQIKYLKLDSGDEHMTGEPTSVIIYGVYQIKAKNESFYLLLGWGTYGGGQHHSLARVYRFKDNTLELCDSMFGGQKHLPVYANRVDKINLKYNPKSKELSHFYYEFDPDNGFHKREQQKVTWVFKNGTFQKRQK